MGSKPSTFYGLEAKKISADGEKVALFTTHPGSLGAFREARLREYISEHLPKRYAVASGFVTTHDPDDDNIYDRSTKQIDCLVYDESEYAPLLRAADFSVVEPNSVAAIIEIKSNLTITKNRSSGADHPHHDDQGGFTWQGTFVDALLNVTSAIKLMREANVVRDNFFAAILSYNATSVGQFIAAVTSGELQSQLGLTDLDDLPTIVSTFNSDWFAFSAYEYEIDGTDADPSKSFLLHGKNAQDGSSLQVFTAYLAHTFSEVRGGRAHTVGGLRSAKSDSSQVDSHPFLLPSPRQHGL